MSENFDPVELQQIELALRAYKDRCEEILQLLGEKRSLSLGEREQIVALYAALKDDLKAAAKHGTLSKSRRQQTRAETCFFDPAVRRAVLNLRPATNTNPISSHWFSAVFEAQSEFSYWLHNMDKAGSD